MNSLPGMMTGQILGGSPVTEAARYQVLIIWLIGTINFSSVFMNTYIVYKVAFETSKHMLRTERFIKVIRSKKRKGISFKRFYDTFRSTCILLMTCGRNKQTNQREDYLDIEQQSLESLSRYGATDKICNLTIQMRQQDKVDSAKPLLQISKLQFSVPRSHTKYHADKLSLPPSTSSSSLPSVARSEQQKRILCRDLDFTLHEGEIGIIRGKSGSGKSTLLRVISGLTPLDEGQVTADGMPLTNSDMTRWRSMIRYVTQYKVDIPGSECILSLLLRDTVQLMNVLTALAFVHSSS